jgi:hypothetical protein
MKTKKEKGFTIDGEDTIMDYIPKWAKEELKKKKGKLSRKKRAKNKREGQMNKRQSPPFKVPIINPPFADNSGFLTILTGSGFPFKGR